MYSGYLRWTEEEGGRREKGGRGEEGEGRREEEGGEGFNKKYTKVKRAAIFSGTFSPPSIVGHRLLLPL